MDRRARRVRPGRAAPSISGTTRTSPSLRVGRQRGQHGQRWGRNQVDSVNAYWTRSGATSPGCWSPTSTGRGRAWTRSGHRGIRFRVRPVPQRRRLLVPDGLGGGRTTPRPRPPGGTIPISRRLPGPQLLRPVSTYAGWINGVIRRTGPPPRATGRTARSGRAGSPTPPSRQRVQRGRGHGEPGRRGVLAADAGQFSQPAGSVAMTGGALGTQTTCVGYTGAGRSRRAGKAQASSGWSSAPRRSQRGVLAVRRDLIARRSWWATGQRVFVQTDAPVVEQSLRIAARAGPRASTAVGRAPAGREVVVGGSPRPGAERGRSRFREAARRWTAN